MGRLSEALAEMARHSGSRSHGVSGVSSGGGGVNVEMDRESMALLKRMAREDPAAWQRASARSAAALRRSMWSVVRRHGDPQKGVPKLASRQRFTVALHGGKPKDVFGKFSEDDTYFRAWTENGVQYCGWVNKLGGWMSALQSAQRRDIPADDRNRFAAHIHSHGIHGLEVPERYDRPERDVIENYSRWVAPHYAEWLASNYEKIVTGRSNRRRA